MASLDNGFNAIPRARVDVPGRPDQQYSIWKLVLFSSSDTFTVAELETQSAVADQSSIRVLDPATGISVTAGELDNFNQHEVTVTGGTVGQEVVLQCLHKRGRLNAQAVPPNRQQDDFYPNN